jgi:CRP-like cAMP-binding protein
MLVGLYCEKRAYFPGQIILKEDRNADGMYVVNMGEATLEKNSMYIKTLAPGSHFCSTVMLGVSKKAVATITALKTCHILVITHTHFGLALEKYPCHEVYQDFKKVEIEDNNQFNKALQRMAARKLVWKRYQNMQSKAEDTIFKNPEGQEKDGKELQHQCLLTWARYAGNRAKARKAKLRQKERSERWLQQHRQASERRRSQDEQRLIERGACGFRELEGDSEMRTGIDRDELSPRSFGGAWSPIDGDESPRLLSRSPSPREVSGSVSPTKNLPQIRDADFGKKISPFAVPLVMKKSPRQARSPQSARLPALSPLRKRLASDGDELDVDTMVVHSARARLEYDAEGTPLAKQRLMRGMPSPLDNFGDLPGKVFDLGARVRNNNTQLFWQGFAV